MPVVVIIPRLLIAAVLLLLLAAVSVSGFHPCHTTIASPSRAPPSSSQLLAMMTGSSTSNINEHDSADDAILAVVAAPDHTLFDVPVSNNGAKIRIILYKKGITNEQVTILNPAHLGGLKSDEYKKLSPLGLMPCLTLPPNHRDNNDEKNPIQNNENHGLSSLVESDTIARYLLSKYADIGPTFQPDNPKSNLISRWHDMYLTTIQGCMYKPASRLPFGDYPDRKSALKAYRKHWNIIESSFLTDNDQDSIYLCGKEISLADASLFPSAVFANYMLPKFDVSPPESPPLPPKLTRWFHNLRANDGACAKVYDEITDALVNSWENTHHRWDTIRGAGVRDAEPSTVFDSILDGTVPAAIVRENDHVLAFKDVRPLAPAHILVVPKDRNGLTSLRRSSEEHVHVLGRLLVMAGEIAGDASLGFGDGARIVINDGRDGGQEVQHLHVHVLGGRRMESTSFG